MISKSPPWSLRPLWESQLQAPTKSYISTIIMSEITSLRCLCVDGVGPPPPSPALIPSIGHQIDSLIGLWHTQEAPQDFTWHQTPPLWGPLLGLYIELMKILKLHTILRIGGTSNGDQQIYWSISLSRLLVILATKLFKVFHAHIYWHIHTNAVTQYL